MMASSTRQLLLIVCFQLIIAADSWIIEDISTKSRLNRPNVVLGRSLSSERSTPYYEERNDLKYTMSGIALPQVAGHRERQTQIHGIPVENQEKHDRRAKINSRRIEKRGRPAAKHTRPAEKHSRPTEKHSRPAEKHSRPAERHSRPTERHSSSSADSKKSSVVNYADKECVVQKVFPVNSGIPCNLTTTQTPMFVYFSFDDAITPWNIRFYRQLFSDEHRNPDGCPIRATFFNSHHNTQYGLLQELWQLKHEVASHSISHRGPSTWWSINATQQDWYDEIVGQRDNIHRQTAAAAGSRGGIPIAEIQGMRAPFLALGGDLQFGMLERNGFLYDSSIPNNNNHPSWPFTLHEPSAMNGPICRSPYCPVEPHNVWEVVMNVYFMNESGSVTPCSMIDGCRPRNGRLGALRFLRANFQRHYDDKVPFGINMHAAWFAFEGYLDAMNSFIGEMLERNDVYIVPIRKLIEWIKHPLTISKMNEIRFSC